MKNLKEIILATTIIATSALTSGCVMYGPNPQANSEDNHCYIIPMLLGFPGNVEYISYTHHPPILRRPFSTRR